MPEFVELYFDYGKRVRLHFKNRSTSSPDTESLPYVQGLPNPQFMITIQRNQGGTRMNHNENRGEMTSEVGPLEDKVPGLGRFVVSLQTAFPSLSKRTIAAILGLPETPLQHQRSDLKSEQR